MLSAPPTQLQGTNKAQLRVNIAIATVNREREWFKYSECATKYTPLTLLLRTALKAGNTAGMQLEGDNESRLISA